MLTVALTSLAGPADAEAASAATSASAAAALTAQAWLKPDTAGAERYAHAVSTPGNRLFHHYLSPDAYRARFEPSAVQASTVSRWLTGHGATSAAASPGRDYLTVTGPAATVRSLLAANSRSTSVSVKSQILGVTGLSTSSSGSSAAPTHAVSSKTTSAKTAAPTCSAYWAQHTHDVRPAYRGIAKAPLPVCGYSAKQIRSAYGATPANTGKGQTIAFTELDAPNEMPHTLTEFARRNHLPAPATGQFTLVQQHDDSTCPSGSAESTSAKAAPADPMYDVESEMDSEAAYTMAPDAKQLMVVGAGCDEDQGFLNAVSYVLTGNGKQPAASIISNSWQISDTDTPRSVIHAMDVRAAAEGVGLYFSSGDTTGLVDTAADPFVTAVGGTSLGIGAHDRRVFETGWSDDSAVLDGKAWSDIGVTAGGGGVSADYHQPDYQKGVVPASMSRVKPAKGAAFAGRAVPDVAADADPTTGLLVGYSESQGPGKPSVYRTAMGAGTSLSCPLVAGLVADAQQGQRSNFGFANPLLYRMARADTFHDALPVTKATPALDRATYAPASGTDSATVSVFDDQDRSQTSQVTAKGYDTMTGIGTPRGGAFIGGLRLAAFPGRVG